MSSNGSKRPAASPKAKIAQYESVRRACAKRGQMIENKIHTSMLVIWSRATVDGLFQDTLVVCRSGSLMVSILAILRIT